MPEYTIERVSQDEPRKWQSPQGMTIYYIKTKLVGIDKPVSIGKTKPDALKEGYKVNGTIEESDLPENKFKADKMPAGGFGGSQQSFNAPSTQSGIDTQESIARSVALKAAVDAVQVSTQGKGQEFNVDEYLRVADKFLAWLQNTPSSSEGSESPNPKGSESTQSTSKQTKNGFGQSDDDAVDTYKQAVTDEFGEMPADAIPLDSIPF